jgi:hypothetical protein
MLVSQLAPAVAYPRVQSFLTDVLDMQFADVRAMLQLPRPAVGITPACNFAIVSTLCNLISGISTTIFKPLKPLCEAPLWNPGSGHAFQEFVRIYFPYAPPSADYFPRQLYELCRNPMAHSAGLNDTSSFVVLFTRIFDPSHVGIGWSDQELEDIERPDRPFSMRHPGVVVDQNRWILHCDSFYVDVIEMLRRLNADAAQMKAAETRFNQGVYNWRR